MNPESLQKNSSILMLTYVGYSDLFPEVKPDIRELQNRLKYFDLLETVLILSKLNLFLSDFNRPFDQARQINLSKLFLNEYTLERLKKRFNKNTIIFHRHQILFMLKNAFLTCQTISNRSFTLPHVRSKLGTCFLIANDLLSLQNIDENELDRQEIEKKKEFIWKESLPGWELNNPAHPVLVVSRMRIILKRILPTLRNTDSFIDLDEIYKSSTGLNIDESMFFIFGFLSFYNKNRREIIKDPNAIYIIKDRLLEKARKEISGEKLNLFLNHVSLPLSAYRDEIIASKDLEFNYGFLPFRKYPLVKINFSAYFCLDFYLMLEKLYSDIFWTINDSLSQQEREKYRIFWGMLFEKYINMLMSECLCSNSVIFISRPYYENTKDEISDGVLISDNNLVLFEYKFTLLNQQAKLERSIDSLVQEIRTKFERSNKGEWKGYGQLANNINKLFMESGKYTCRQINRDRIKRIFPVLIVYDDVLQTPFTNYIFNRNFQKLINWSKLKKDIEIYPLTVMTIEDFEKSLPFMDNLVDILKERFQLDRDLDYSFSQYLHAKNFKTPIKVHGVLFSEYLKFSSEIKSYFFDNIDNKEL